MGEVLRLDADPAATAAAGAAREDGRERPDGAVPALRLVFDLPAALVLRAEPGRHQPCLHGCLLTVARDGRVAIQGRDRAQVFEQARRFLRIAAKGIAPQKFAAVLITPPGRFSPASLGGRDSYTIVTGAAVTIAAANAGGVDIGCEDAGLTAR